MMKIFKRSLALFIGVWLIALLAACSTSTETAPSTLPNGSAATKQPTQASQPTQANGQGNTPHTGTGTITLSPTSITVSGTGSNIDVTLSGTGWKANQPLNVRLGIAAPLVKKPIKAFGDGSISETLAIPNGAFSGSYGILVSDSNGSGMFFSKPSGALIVTSSLPNRKGGGDFPDHPGPILNAPTSAIPGSQITVTGTAYYTNTRFSIQLIKMSVTDGTTTILNSTDVITDAKGSFSAMLSVSKLDNASTYITVSQTGSVGGGEPNLFVPITPEAGAVG